MTTLLHEIAAAALFAIGFLALFAVAERLRRNNLAPPEVSRKFVHVGGCIGAMAFPFIFRSPWTVVALAILFSTGIGVAQRVWCVRSLDDVDRVSDGGLLHPLALGACYLVSDTFGRVADYEISMAVLAFSDTAAALVGRHWGRFRYCVEPGSERTAEGSAAFFSVTFVVVFLALRFADPALPIVGPALLALLIAMLATLFEAISWGGADNLVVPLATLEILLKSTPPDPATICRHFALLAISLAVLHIVLRPYRTVGLSGYLAFALCAYLAASLVAPKWGLAVVMAAALAGHPGPIVPAPAGAHGKIRIRQAFRLLALPALLLFVVNLLALSGLDLRKALFPVFIACLALSLVWLRLSTHPWRHRRLRRALSLAISLGTAIVGGYLLAAVVFSAIPLNRGAGHRGDIGVYVLSNGVHIDLVLPVRNERFDWTRVAPPSDVASPIAANAPWISFGWGDRGFYLNVLDWGDLTAATALRAVSGMDGTALHAERFFHIPAEGADCHRLDLDATQYDALVAFLLESGVRYADGRLVPVAGATDHGQTDAFYESRGRYSPLFTCNTWANTALKRAGAPCCLWTPFPYPILRHAR